MKKGIRFARIMQGCGNIFRQTDATINLTYQHQTSITADYAASEIGFNHASPKATKTQVISGTLWDRWNFLQLALTLVLKRLSGGSAVPHVKFAG